MNRRLGRTKAFFVIYQIEFYKEYDIDEIFENTVNFQLVLEVNEEETITDLNTDFVYEISSGTHQNLEIIDEQIEKYSEKWSFDRINKIDLAILRISLFEILFREDIPINVSINEAVELAKEYGEDNSYKFINGILGQIVKNEEIIKKSE